MVDEMFNFSIKAYVLAIVTRGTEHDAAEKIRNINNITETIVTYGMGDLIIRIETKSLEELDEIINNIRQIKEIEQTNTLIGI